MSRVPAGAAAPSAPKTEEIERIGRREALPPAPLSYPSGVFVISMNLTGLLTEQPNPASDHIDALATADVLAIINREDQGVALAVCRRDPPHRRGCGPHRGAGAARAGGCSISALEPVDGWESSTPPSVRRHFKFRRRWCRASWPAAKRPWHARPRLPKTIRKPGGAIWLLAGSLRKTLWWELPPAAARLTCWALWRRPTSWAR